MNFYKLPHKLKKSFFSIGLIIFILIIANRALLKNVIYESDDYKYHAIRTANYYLALKDGQLPVRWGANLNQGYGYPSFNYMYHVPYIIGSIIHSLGFTIQQSLNMTVLIAILLAAISCYLFVKAYLKQEKWSVLLSLFFVLNPYMLLNVYWRGAIGELFFIGFVPLLMLGIKKLLDKNNYFYFLLIALTVNLLILSHLPSMLLLLPLLTIFIFLELNKELQFKKIIYIVMASTLGLLLSSWYLIPAYFEQWMIRYQNGNSLSQYLTQFSSPVSIFNINRNFFSSDYFLNVIQIGSVSFLSLIIGLYLLKYSKKILFWLGLFFSSLFLLSSYSKFLWDKIELLKYVQFPWRFLWLITFSSIMILINFVLEKKISRNIKNAIAILISLSIIFSSKNYIANKGNLTRTDFDWYHPTFETGSSFDEHQPIWSKLPYYFPEELMYLEASRSALITTDNYQTYVHELKNLKPKILKFNGKTISYQITPGTDIIALHKRLFYPGWEASIDNQKVKFIKNIPEYNGILAIKIPAKTSLVTVTFSGYTKLRKFSEIISLITLLIIIGGAIIIRQYEKN